ncbi:MAG: type II secretion system minor pseudopilin GspK [Pseudomonadota bacterium]
MNEPRPVRCLNRQRGVALITALLVVALATMAAAAMTYRQQLDVRRTGNTLALERGVHYARGLELWALAALELDARESPGLDSRQEPWASELPVIELPEGRLRGRLVDLDGRLNLNNLVVDGRRQSDWIARFERLLTVLNLDPALAQRCVDWIDVDSTAEPGGAEDDRYLSRQPPYRAANAPFAHLSELRLIDGVTAEVFDQLAPHVTVLPTPLLPTPVNVNTASIPVLMSLHPAITQQVATALYQDGQASFRSLTDFYAHPSIRPRAQSLLVLQQSVITLDSRFFLARGVIEVEERVRRFASLIAEQGGRFDVLWRLPEAAVN